MSTPIVSVCIAAYNCERYIVQCLDSVCAQTCGDFEIIISDNASTDNTWEVIQSFKEDRIRRFRQPTNLGPQDNFNFVIREAKGCFIHTFCADDVMLPHLLDTQVTLLQKHPRVALVSCEAIATDEELKKSICMLGCLTGYLTKSEILHNMQHGNLANRLGGPSNFLFRSRHRDHALYEKRFKFLSDLHFALKLLDCGDYFGSSEPGYLYRRHDLSDTNLTCPPAVQNLDWANLAIEHQLMNAKTSARLLLASQDKSTKRRVADWRKENLSVARSITSALAAYLRTLGDRM